jgi:hypothetical protein
MVIRFRYASVFPVRRIPRVLRLRRREMVETPERKRAVSIVIYDLQGGPFPERAVQQIKTFVENIAEAYDGLAITIVEE